MIERIKSYSPNEVYVLSAVYFLTLFLNFSEFMDSRFRFGDVFEIRRSIIYGLIRGVGDDYIRPDDALTLYWVILLTSVLLVALKARRISEWMWRR